MPPKSSTVVSKTHWKPSVAEAREGLFFHVKTPGDIEKSKKEQIDRKYSKGLTVQPYLIILGQNLSNVSKSYVVLNNVTYECSSVLDALNFCYQAYQVLDALYPFECRHIWSLIQWNIYKYRSKRDPRIPYISDLVYKE